MKITGNEPLRFAVLTDTHISPARTAVVEQLGRTYAALAGMAPDFVLHCGDITDTGLPHEYDLYQQAVPAALRGRIRHVPGNHEVRWDPTAKELYQAQFGAAPYSFDAAGVHFIGFDPTQPLLEPGHCGREGLHWLDRDLAGLDRGRPVIMYHHFPVGRGHDYIDDQDALLDLLARHRVRALFAGHIHRETVTRLGRLTQVTLTAFADGPSCYWAETARSPAGHPELMVSRLDLAGDATQERHLVARVPLSGSWPGRRPKRPRRAVRPSGWRVRLAGSVQGGISAAGSTVVAASTVGQVTALRPEDGGVRWQASLGPVYRRAAFDSTGRTVFIPSGDRHLYALDAGTGQARWRFDAGAPVLSAPLVAAADRDEYVVFGAGPQLFAVAAGTGRLAWSVPGRGWSAGRGACDGQRVYTCAADGYACAHDLRSGQEAWSYRMVTGGDEHRVALYSGWDCVVALGAGTVVVATVSGSHALDAATGALRWSFPDSAMYPPAVVLDDGSALLTSEQGTVSRVALADGEIIWQARLDARIQNAGPVVAGDRAWVVSEAGWLIGVRLADGWRSGSRQLTRARCFSAPAVVDGTLIAGDQDGFVHGIRLA
ncbi:MAG: PQQ-binding-like beta-propeller repeat protein [Streptosporangiaceae bacterium]